ncbi:hypothetical protein D5S17_09460 [Pseudonocardiaceae bacterium YIM PH 21723]|nr:hypothetical protein D5S17_09460 [Pseudonocardiaceae bacterium YIM PH 21723]
MSTAGELAQDVQAAIDKLTEVPPEHIGALIDEYQGVLNAVFNGSNSKLTAAAIRDVALAKSKVEEAYKFVVLTAAKYGEIQENIGVSTGPSVSASSGSKGGSSPAAAAGTRTAKPAARKHPPATFGWTTDFNYRRTFFTANPETKGQVWVHHAVERQVITNYPGVVAPQEMHSLENLRGIPSGEVNRKVHLSALRRAWNAFYLANPNPTKQQLLDEATRLDDLYGNQFNPAIREPEKDEQ